MGVPETLTLEALFEDRPKAKRMFDATRSLIEALGPSKMGVRKTQVAFRVERNFALVWLPQMWVRRPEGSITLAFALGRRVDHPRIEESVEPRPGQWTHHVIVEEEADLDGDVRGWLAEAYAFGCAKKPRG